MSTRLGSLLNKIVQAAPNALVVVAKLTPLGYTSAALATYNSQIPGVIQAHVAKGQHIVGVDMSKMPVPATSDRTTSIPTTRATPTWRLVRRAQGPPAEGRRERRRYRAAASSSRRALRRRE